MEEVEYIEKIFKEQALKKRLGKIVKHNKSQESRGLPREKNTENDCFL